MHKYAHRYKNMQSYGIIERSFQSRVLVFKTRKFFIEEIYKENFLGKKIFCKKKKLQKAFCGKAPERKFSVKKIIEKKFHFSRK